MSSPESAWDKVSVRLRAVGLKASLACVPGCLQEVVGVNEFVWRREWGEGGVFLLLMDSPAVDRETVCSGLWPAAAALQASPLQLKRKRACCAGGTGRSGGGCSDASRVRWRRKWEAEKSPPRALRGLGPWLSQMGTGGNRQSSMVRASL